MYWKTSKLSTKMIKTTEDPLIMTASFSPKNVPFLNLTDPHERRVDYICALISWITLSSFKKIIFVENTGTTFDFSKILKLAGEHSTTLEILTYDGNANSEKFGKGYGEGELLEHAIKYSKILQTSKRFYKITGRIYVKNFSQIEKLYKDYSNFFFGVRVTGPKAANLSKKFKKIPVRMLGKILRFLFKHHSYLSSLTFELYQRIAKLPNDTSTCETIFFKSEVSFFKNHLIDVHKNVNDHINNSLEDCYKKTLLTFPRYIFWKPKIVYVGRSGTSKTTYNEYYKEKIVKQAEEYFIA